MRVACWRAIFNGTVMIPGSQWRNDQMVQSRAPNAGGGSTPEVTIVWCGTHVELCGPQGTVIVPAHKVDQVDVEEQPEAKPKPAQAPTK